MIEGGVRQSDNRWRVEGEVSVPVCLQWACHMYRGGKHQGSTLTQERGFAIFGKRERSCATIVRRPIANPPQSDGHIHSPAGLRLNEMADRDKTRGEGNRH